MHETRNKNKDKIKSPALAKKRLERGTPICGGRRGWSSNRLLVMTSETRNGDLDVPYLWSAGEKLAHTLPVRLKVCRISEIHNMVVDGLPGDHQSVV
jgi:hypothetical protein